ncbi:MAG: hypothetical protein HY695_05650 [Deltaproteobacteria bacterium]|nr:hypothetical protein [Deltaproteobacteria bacterium]
MIRPEFKKSLESQQTILLLLWTFFVSGIFIYLWITEFVLRRSGFLASSAAETVRMILWLLAFIDLGTFIWWRNRFLAKEAILGGTKKYKTLQVLQEHTTPLEERAAQVVSSYVTSKIVAYAIVEAMAVYGLVLAAIGGYVRDQYLFSIASLLLLVIEFPSRSYLATLLKEVEARG